MAEILVRRDDSPPQPLPIAATVTVGGGALDAIAVAGLPAGLLSIVRSSRGDLLVEARGEGARVGERPLRPGARRLLRPGDEVVLPGVRIIALAAASLPADDATRALVGSLLADAAAGSALPLEPRLVVLEGPGAGDRLAVRDGFVLGRGDASDVRVADARMSRAHVRFALRDGRVTLRDLGSKNGVAVNERRARREVTLAAGDLVEIGATLLAFEAGLEGRTGAATCPAPERPAAEAPPLAGRRSATLVPTLGAGALLAAAAALCLAAAG
jgi:hypothetical protein